MILTIHLLNFDNLLQLSKIWKKAVAAEQICLKYDMEKTTDMGIQTEYKMKNNFSSEYYFQKMSNINSLITFNLQNF